MKKKRSGQDRREQRDNAYVSPHILRTYYGQEHIPTGTECAELGIDPTRVFHIENGPRVSAEQFDARVDAIMATLLERERGHHPTS